MKECLETSASAGAELRLTKRNKKGGKGIGKGDLEKIEWGWKQRVGKERNGV